MFFAAMAAKRPRTTARAKGMTVLTFIRFSSFGISSGPRFLKRANPYGLKVGGTGQEV
jgi:hypothetical protein